MGLSLDSKEKAAIASFFEQTEAALCTTPEQVAAAVNAMLSGENASRMVNQVTFNVSHALNDEAQAIIQNVCKGLGALASDETNIGNMLWKSAASRLTDRESVQDATRSFLLGVEASSNTVRRYIAENRLVALQGVDRLQIGPVSVVSGNWLAKDLSENTLGNQWIAEVGEHGLRPAKDGRFTFAVSPCNWDIGIVAARANLEEEAAWLAGVAVSLLRLTAAGTIGPFVGGLGKTEPHVFRDCSGDKTAITMDDGGITAGGWSRPAKYQISAETITRCSMPAFREIAEHVFSPPRKSVAERMRQCLGWLARGRQSEDRAERFLYFFTALESLLSSDDNSTPVTQTIARNVATILTDDPTARSRNAKLVKSLYSARSGLVHAGRRGVNRRQANTIEHIVELVCWRILDQVALSQSVREFQEALLYNSYGSAWGDASKGRLIEIATPEVGEVQDDAGEEFWDQMGADEGEG